MNDIALYWQRIGIAPGDPVTLSPWPWNPGDTVLSTGAKPVGRKDFEGDGVVAGLWKSNAVTVRIDGHPVNEVCFVIEGTVTLSTSGRAETFGVGEAFLIHRGFKGLWSNSDNFAKLFAAVANS